MFHLSAENSPGSTRILITLFSGGIAIPSDYMNFADVKEIVHPKKLNF